jgi:transcriptional regulator with XRE-family HTH domain
MLFTTDKELAEQLGQRIRTARIAQRVTQRNLAAKAGIHVNTLRSLERTGEAKLSSFIAVLRALGARAGIEELLAESPPQDLYTTPRARPPQRVRERRK